MNEIIRQEIEAAGIIAVVSIDDADHAIPLANALLQGGVKVIELTLRTAAALDSIHLVSQNVPELLVGAGTVLDIMQISQVQQAGARFAVAPGFNPRVVSAAKQAKLPFAPGVCTPSDVEAALELDCQVLKFFPAEGMGGIHYLRSMAAPYAHLGLQFVPLGGISADNAASYLSENTVLALGGSWVASRAAIEKQDWTGIAERAAAASKIVAQVRKAKKEVS